MKHSAKRHFSSSSILPGLVALLLSLQVSTGLAEDPKLPKELSPEAAEAVKKAIQAAEARAKGVDPEKAKKQAEKEAKAKAAKEAKAAKAAKRKAEKEAKAQAKLEKEEKAKVTKKTAASKSAKPAKSAKGAEESAQSAAEKKPAATKSGTKDRDPGPKFDRKRSPGTGGDYADGRLTGGALLGDMNKGIADLFVPVYKSDSGGLLFLDPRFTADDEEEQQFAVGLGWRQNLAERDMIVGGNVFYDSIWTEGDAQFNQIGFGLELLTELIDARFNYYLPEDDLDGDGPSAPRSAAASSPSTTVFPGGARLAGATVFPGGARLRSSSAGTSSGGSDLEPSFEGFDVEVGVKLPIDNIPETRVFAGLQVFDNALGGDDFEGFVGRVEMRPTPGVTLDVQFLTEDELNNDANWFAGVRINLPFSLAELAKGHNPFAGSSSVFESGSGSFDSRMYEYLIRNPQ